MSNTSPHRYITMGLSIGAFGFASYGFSHHGAHTAAMVAEAIGLLLFVALLVSFLRGVRSQR